MDLGPQTISVFVTLFLILAAMGVALIVDLLKGNNEQLRELAIELKAKKDAAERHLESLEVHTAALLQRPVLAAGAAAVSKPLLSEAEAMPRPSIVPNNRPTAAASAKAADRPADAGANPEAGFHAAARKGREASAQQPKREMSPAVAAVAQSVEARMAAGKMNPAAAAVAATVVEEPVLPEVQPSVVAAPAAAAVVAGGMTPEIIPVAVNTGVFQTSAEARKDWSRILTNRKHEEPPPAAVSEEQDNLIRFEAPGRVPVVEESKSLPVGFHDSVLRKAAASGMSLQGMVVSIGLNQLDGSQMSEVSRFVQSLLEAGDFGCQSGSDEFVLVCPGDGPASQRRLSGIAERLWDFQLRSMGQLNVQFAWGGMEARATDRLNDAVASAIDQMTETRRARRGSTVQIAKAV
jgi:hypothetical protein